MKNNAVFAQRKELKKCAHTVVRRHYILLVFLTLILTLFGTEFSYSIMGWGSRGSEESSETSGYTGNFLSARKLFASEDVLSAIISGRFDDSISRAEEIVNQMKAEESAGAMGRTNGILAELVNNVDSGKVYTFFGQLLRRITQSDRAASVLFVTGLLAWYALIYFFFRNVYSAVIRRIYLEARIYSNVSFLSVAYFAVVHRWIRASWVMLVRKIYSLLWSLTIVGGIIKFFSYWAVPYIVAENPSVSANEAVTLSRRMMDGHKLELFKYLLTLAGWVLLGAVTLGISDMLYGTPYILACESEFYAKIREEAIEKKIPGYELFTDPYLFGKADRILLYETYFDVVDEITLIHENRVVLKGARKNAAEWFGVWFGSLKSKRAYDRQEGRINAISHYKQCMEGNAYPGWLNPLWKKRKLSRGAGFNYNCSYTVWTLFLLFITFSFVGWVWEVALHYMQLGEFANRGTLHGPWLPIYGGGGLIALLLCSRFRKNPVAEFFTATALCGVLEYFSGWLLEMKYHERWWSYDGYFLNLHGRICAEGLLVFGVACCIVVYLLAPLFDFLLSLIYHRLLIGICIVLAVIFGVDTVYSGQHPNMAEGAIEVSVDGGEVSDVPPEAESAADAAIPALIHFRQVSAARQEARWRS